jgi:hypothetical protein
MWVSFPEKICQPSRDALIPGQNGKNLRYLAGLSSPAGRDILEIIDGALRELGVPAPVTPHDAASRMARRLADDIVARRIEPYEAACRICLSYASELEHWSDIVIYYEAEAEARNAERAKLQIEQAARFIVYRELSQGNYRLGVFTSYLAYELRNNFG